MKLRGSNVLNGEQSEGVYVMTTASASDGRCIGQNRRNKGQRAQQDSLAGEARSSATSYL